MNFVLNLPTDTFIRLLEKATEKEAEDKLWERWLAELPSMQMNGQFVSFDAYKTKALNVIRNEEKPEEEILEDAQNILKLMNIHKPK